MLPPPLPSARGQRSLRADGLAQLSRLPSTFHRLPWPPPLAPRPLVARAALCRAPTRCTHVVARCNLRPSSKRFGAPLPRQPPPRWPSPAAALPRLWRPPPRPKPLLCRSRQPMGTRVPPPQPRVLPPRPRSSPPPPTMCDHCRRLRSRRSRPCHRPCHLHSRLPRQPPRTPRRDLLSPPSVSTARASPQPLRPAPAASAPPARAAPPQSRPAQARRVQLAAPPLTVGTDHCVNRPQSAVHPMIGRTRR